MNNNFSTDILDVNISDHQFIHLNRKHCSKPKSKLDFTGSSYRNSDKAVFCDRLLNVDWNELYMCDDVNVAWNIMLRNITAVIDEMCPLKKYKITQHDWNLTRNARNNVNIQIRRTKANFVQENLNQNQNNSKKSWQNIKDVLPNSKDNQNSKISLNNDANNFITDNKEMANQINNYFTTIGPSLATNMNDPWN